MKTYELLREFCRYLLVGGTAFLVDLALLYLFKNYVLFNWAETGVYISTAIGFIGGLIYNYILSLFFVFESAKEKNRGKSIEAFIIFSAVGVIGLFLTEIGMYVGIELLEINYLIVKFLVAGIVLFWNYCGRKVLIFK
ncbi:MAG: GtrA family protein [Clostridiaceae bacterium]